MTRDKEGNFIINLPERYNNSKYYALSLKIYKTKTDRATDRETNPQ